MASHSSLLILLLPSLLLCPATALVQINKILSQFPEFSSFNNYLNQTNLTAAIDVRQTITVLTVDNSIASALSSQPADALKNLLSVHVILDYYDDTKLQNLPNKTALLTTLFQTSGQAVGQTGFLNATVTSSGQVAFGSAVPDSPLSSDLVKVVVTHPYNISVLQISSLIVPPGVGAGSLNHSVSPTPSLAPKTAPTPATAPSPSSKGGTVIPVKPGSPAKSPSNSDAPSPAPKVPKAASPAASPAANAPAPSDDSSAGAPESDAPGASPPSPPAPPRARPPTSSIADAPGKGGHSGSTRVVAGSGLVVAVGVAFLAGL